MKKRLFYFATIVFFMELFIFSVSRVSALPGSPSGSPSGSPPPPIPATETGGWYYHNLQGTAEGWVHVNSSYEDAQGRVWKRI